MLNIIPIFMPINNPTIKTKLIILKYIIEHIADAFD